MRLSIPAGARWVLVARMALAGFASQLGADIDTVEDIRTLTDEACYCLMHQPCAAETLTITAGPVGDGARLRFETTFAAAVCAGEAHDPEIAKGILSTLARDVLLEMDGVSAKAIELSVRLAPL